MTLDEAIEKQKTVAKMNYELAESYHTDFNVYMRQESACRERAEIHEQIAEWLEELQNLKEQEPCGDCISRQEVLAIAGDSCLDLDSYDDTKKFCDEIKALPPVTPQEPILDNIRAGIMKLQTFKMFRLDKEDEIYVERADVLSIIDKYKVGSEVLEWSRTKERRL